EGHHRPGPDEHPTEGGQAQREQGEDAGRRRYVAERDGERAEQPERALELLGVAEAGEIGGVPFLPAGKISAHVRGLRFRPMGPREAKRTSPAAKLSRPFPRWWPTVSHRV